MGLLAHASKNVCNKSQKYHYELILKELFVILAVIEMSIFEHFSAIMLRWRKAKKDIFRHYINHTF